MMKQLKGCSHKSMFLISVSGVIFYIELQISIRKLFSNEVIDIYKLWFL